MAFDKNTQVIYENKYILVRSFAKLKKSEIALEVGNTWISFGKSSQNSPITSTDILR